MQNIKKYALWAFGAWILYTVVSLVFCGGGTEEVEVPTTGLITTVQEVEKDKFKIEDEQTVSKPEESLIVAKYMDGKIDTFTLEEAKLVEAGGSGISPVQTAVFAAAGAGFLGYMMGRSMGGGPAASAYTSPQAHQRVAAGSGNTFRSSMTRTSVPRGGSSGFGGGRSTRSVGG